MVKMSLLCFLIKLHSKKKQLPCMKLAVEVCGHLQLLHFPENIYLWCEIVSMPITTECSKPIFIKYHAINIWFEQALLIQ